jgi:hypothetical protein
MNPVAFACRQFAENSSKRHPTRGHEAQQTHVLPLHLFNGLWFFANLSKGLISI